MAKTVTTDIELLPSDLEVLETRVHTGRARCENVQNKIRDVYYQLQGVRAEAQRFLKKDAHVPDGLNVYITNLDLQLADLKEDLAKKQAALERDIRICDAVAELMLEP